MEPLNTLQVTNHLSKRSAIWLPRSIMVGIATIGLIAHHGLENAMRNICRDGNLESLQYIRRMYFSGATPVTIQHRALLTNMVCIAARSGRGELVFELIASGAENNTNMHKFIGAIIAPAAANNHKKLVYELFAYIDANQIQINEKQMNAIVRQTAEHGRREMMNHIFVEADKRKISITWATIKESANEAASRNYKDILDDILARSESFEANDFSIIIGRTVAIIARYDYEDLLLHIIKYADIKNNQISLFHIEAAMDDAALFGQAEQLGHLFAYADREGYVMTPAMLGEMIHELSDHSFDTNTFRTIVTHADKNNIAIPGTAIAALNQALLTDDLFNDLSSESQILAAFELKEALAEYAAAHQL